VSKVLFFCCFFFFFFIENSWHDYVAAAARLFRNDSSNYRMPSKADPQIVVKHIRESHVLLARTVKARGGVAIGGMYGVLPVTAGQPLQSDSMQVCVRGMIRDILVQLRRGLDG
jgi:malate synthase